ncbi:DUF1385 domain-containing protein [Herbivorax sp. ANBcel31]|uniref:DUF1385 domain-containing protein n=1 Tax=Herbivorax sp. ANBcel31 TaxID=3069754 RepID=UPI0027B5B2DD|nr:DUF1385 domain-containing protein [Herbivorax sp. ANBcel31]MDQ2086557.1 DUF1385 domain-containing protein [Herbivorax sp. ANBcel31]
MNQDNSLCKPKHKTSIGGQALIEGLMMIGSENAAIAIRKPDGEIIVEKRPTPKKNIFTKIPIIRGAVGLFKQMILGFKALMYSAEFVDIEEDVSEEDEENKEPSKIDKFLEKVFGDKLQDVLIYFSVILSLFFSVGLFMLLPNFLSELTLTRLFAFEEGSKVLIYNVFEGLIRICLFLAYLYFASKLKDIKRVWQYHGSEHKTIHCYENQKELTVENIKKYPTAHPRCGTSFLFTVMIVSILVFSATGRHDQIIINLLMRIMFLPLVAGISYEITRFAGRSESKILGIVNAPGLLFQKFTTKEPDESQIEVAIEAMKNVLVEDKKADKW